jgi:hypothetical protein
LLWATGSERLPTGSDSQPLRGAVGKQSTENFGVKDGLLFNAVKPDDKITFPVETVNSQKRISKLERQ